MSFGHALYYPYININNKNWIKHAMLFWGNVSRIVPSSVEPSDSEDIIKIKHETGFIKDYNPESYDTADAFYQFSRELRPFLESDRFFNDRYFNEPRGRGRYMRNYQDKRRFFSEMLRDNGTYIHIEKMNPELREYLFDLGIAIPGEHGWDNWIKIDNEVGLLYMTYFARSISHNNSLPVLTDIEQSFSASNYFDSSISSDYNEEFEYKLGNLLIESIVPANINDVPLDKIIEIRTKYDAERTGFFNEVSNLSSSLTTIDNENALEDALQMHSKLIMKETERLDELYNANKIKTIKKFLNISIPAAFTSLTEYVPNEAKPIVTAGGVLFGVLSAASSVKKEKLELQKHPVSYLLNLKSELSGGDMFERINDSIKGIRKW